MRTLHRVLVPVLNLAMRSLTLVGRFGLSIYITKYLGFTAMGQYGLVTGAAAILPALIGLALNYRINREVVGEPLEIAARKVRDRLAVSLGLAVGAVLLGLGAHFAGWLQIPSPLSVIALIMIGECVAFDAHYSLISLQHPIGANALLFIRTSLWVFPIAMLGILMPTCRTIDMIWYGWLMGVIAYQAGLWLIVRNWPLQSFQTRRLDWAWLLRHIRDGRLVYFNDVCLVGLTYSDRFIINHFLGLDRAGHFVYLTSFGTSIYNLCYTSIAQIYMPKFVAAIKERNLHDWGKTIRESLLLSLVFSVVGSVAVCVLLWLLQSRLKIGSSHDILLLFPLICLLNIIRVQSDTINYGIYSIGDDKTLSYIIIFGFFLNTALMISGVLVAQEMGLILGMLVAALVIAAIRIVYVKRYADAHKIA